MGRIFKNRRDRLKHITEMVEQEGFLSTKTLCEEFNLSPMTIARDFQYLCQHDSRFEKIYGGIKNTGNKTSLEKFFIRWDEHKVEKEKIAQCASSLFRSGDRIFLAPGTTTFFIAQEICKRNDLFIITNSLPIACLLPDKTQMVVFFIGGSLIPGELDTHNFQNEALLKNLDINKAVLGTWGIDCYNGITTVHPEGMNQMIIRNSEKTFIVADHTKFGVIAPFKVADIDIIDTVITSDLSPNSEIKAIQERGISVITTK